MIPAPHRFAQVGLLIARNIPQIYLSRRAKVWTRHPCRGIERNQPGIERRFEDAALAYFARCERWIKPRCRASIDETVTIFEALVDLGIVGPELLSCRRIKRDDPVEGRGEIKSSVDKNRRGLKTAPLSPIMTVGDVSGMEDPRDLKLRHIFPVDLRKS